MGGKKFHDGLWYIEIYVFEDAEYESGTVLRFRLEEGETGWVTYVQGKYFNILKLP